MKDDKNKYWWVTPLLECAPLLIWMAAITGICVYVSIYGLK